MTIKSMTGFARVEGAAGPVRWHWEIRSVNGRGLDLRFRLPPGHDSLEPRLREIAQKRLTRGNVNATLSIHREAGAAAIRLNEAALMQVVAAADRARELTGAARPPLEAMLAVRGVLEVAEPDDSLGEDVAKAMVSSFENAVDRLTVARQGEGGRLADVIASQLDQITALVATAANAPSRSLDAVTRRLAEQIARLTEASPVLSPERLHQEAVLIATRIDIEEELKRLTAHIAAARQLLASGEPAGRQLDFLAQEFNREANTLCSKANDPEVTRTGLSLKTVIDQLREQVQNIE